MLRQDLLKKKSLEEAKKKAEAYRQQIQDIANTLLADRNALEDVLKIVRTELIEDVSEEQASGGNASNVEVLQSELGQLRQEHNELIEKSNSEVHQMKMERSSLNGEIARLKRERLASDAVQNKMKIELQTLLKERAELIEKNSDLNEKLVEYELNLSATEFETEQQVKDLNREIEVLKNLNVEHDDGELNASVNVLEFQQQLNQEANKLDSSNEHAE